MLQLRVFLQRWAFDQTRVPCNTEYIHLYPTQHPPPYIPNPTSPPLYTQAPLDVLERAATAVHGMLDGPLNGPLNAQHVIIGATNRDGITPFYNLTDPATGAFTNVSFVPTNASAFPAAMKGYWATVLGATNSTPPQAATQAAAVLGRYPITRYDAHAASAFVAADGDYAVLCPLRRIADLLSAAGVRTYEYTYVVAARLLFSPIPVFFFSVDGRGEERRLEGLKKRGTHRRMRRETRH